CLSYAFFCSSSPRPPRSPLFPYTTLFRSGGVVLASESRATMGSFIASSTAKKIYQVDDLVGLTTAGVVGDAQSLVRMVQVESRRSEEHTSELQSRENLVCRLLLEKKKVTT